MKWLAVGILLLAGSAAAQETPKVEVSAGYSFLRLGGSGGMSQHGATISVAGNMNSWFGLVGDFGAYHSSPFGLGLNTYTYMFGPRFSLRARKVTPFAHVLFGGARLTAGTGGFSSSVTPVAMSTGGGLDLRLSKHIALRPQLEYLLLRSSGGSLNAGRASIGIVFRFGER